LVIDDEESIRFFLTETLTRDGHQVVAVASGEAALAQIAAQTFDVVLLDLLLPGISGIAILGALRQRTRDTAVIVLTGHGSLQTAVEALRHGAHDYLFKPANIIELRASVRTALLKRRRMQRQHDLLQQLTQHLTEALGDHPAAPLPAPPSVNENDEARFLRCGGLILDLMRHVVTLDEQVLELSPTEFALIAYLISEAPRVVPAQELVRAVQGYECAPWQASEAVRYHIHRLRLKFKQVTPRAIIRTVRGVGHTIADS
jgi:DNA-binding response OmpR family regulator